jgi:hypothetical protein
MPALAHFFLPQIFAEMGISVAKARGPRWPTRLANVAHLLCPLDLPEKSPLFSSLEKTLGSKLDWERDGYGREKRNSLAVPSHDPAQHLDHLGLADLIAFRQIASDLADGAVFDDFQRHTAFGRLGA